MENLKKELTFFKAVWYNRIDHGDILGYHIISIMRWLILISLSSYKIIVSLFIPRKFCLWWTSEDYATAPKWAKRINWFFSFYNFFMLSFHLMHCLTNRAEKSILNNLQNVIFCVAGIVGCYAMLLFVLHRRRSTNLLKLINEMNKNVLRRSHNLIENRRYSNRIFTRLPFMCVFGGIFTVLFCLILSLEFERTGQVLFQNFFYQPRPHSIMARVTHYTQILAICFISSAITTYFTMVIEMLLRVSFHFRVTAEEMRQLRKGEEFDESAEMDKLKSLIKDMNFLHW